MKLNQNRLSAQHEQTMFPEVAKVAYRIKSYSGRTLACSSLRPGDVLRSTNGCDYTVIQNSAKLSKIEINGELSSYVITYGMFLHMWDFTLLKPKVSLWYRIKKFLKG